VLGTRMKTRTRILQIVLRLIERSLCALPAKVDRAMARRSWRGPERRLRAELRANEPTEATRGTRCSVICR